MIPFDHLNFAKIAQESVRMVSIFMPAVRLRLHLSFFLTPKVTPCDNSINNIVIKDYMGTVTTKIQEQKVKVALFIKTNIICTQQLKTDKLSCVRTGLKIMYLHTKTIAR